MEASDIYHKPSQCCGIRLKLQYTADNIWRTLLTVSFTVNVVPGDVLLNIEEQTFPQGSTGILDWILENISSVYENSNFTVESSDEDVVEAVHYNDYLLTFENNGDRVSSHYSHYARWRQCC